MGAKKDLDLVLINTGNRKQVFQSLGSTLAAIEPPVWAGLMATFVRKKGFSVAILDANAEGLTPEETAERASQMDPLIVAIVVYGHQPSASTQNMPAAGDVCRVIKQKNPDSNILMVGGHVAALPLRTMKEEDIDFACGGEGPYTLVDLLQALKLRVGDFSKVRGLWYREGGEIKSTSPAPLVENLDSEMSEVAWDLLPMNKYRAHNWHCFGDMKRQPYAALYTTLGCPFHCSFCCIQAPFRSGEKYLGLSKNVNSYRLWSPTSVIAQIDLIVKKYGVRNIKFADELFVLNRDHVDEICDLLIHRNYDLNIWAYARVDTLRNGMAEKLKQAGFNWLAFGIEAANERVRDDARKGFHQNKIFQAINEVRSAGINVIGNYIFGLPEDDLDTMQQTLDLALELNCEFANFYCAMAYPGSKLYELALKNGWPLPESWSGFSQYSFDTMPLPTKYLSPAEVLNFRDKAFHIYFSSEKYLDMINKKFGLETVSQIKEMASHRLERKLLQGAKFDM